MKRNAKRNQREESASAKKPPATPPRITRLLDIPPSVMGGLCQMELSGNREAIIDGCQGVLEYDENVVKLSTGKMNIKFTGRGLQIKVLTRSSAVVEGFITNIEFLV